LLNEINFQGVKMNHSKIFRSSLALLALAAVGCDPISGYLMVNRPLQVKVNTTLPNCNAEMDPSCGYSQSESATLNPGQYRMDIEMITRKDAQIIVSTGKNDLKLDLALNGKDIPATGTVSISSAESGQPFDLLAQTQTSVSRTDSTRGIESCQIVWQQQVCGLVPGDSGKGSNVKNQPPIYKCRMETFSKPGQQEVEFYYETTTQNMQAQIIQSGSQAASFSGSRSNTEKIYTYQGPCVERWL
jgi:hypothetical protein